STRGVTSLVCTSLAAPTMVSSYTRAPSPLLMSLAPHPHRPSVSTLGVRSLASTPRGAPLMASCLTTRAASPRLMLLVPHPHRPSVSTLGVTSWASTRLGGSRMGSCSTRTAALPALTFLAPHPRQPSV